MGGGAPAPKCGETWSKHRRAGITKTRPWNESLKPRVSLVPCPVPPFICSSPARL
jgi:hypothetical protein